MKDLQIETIISQVGKEWLERSDAVLVTNSIPRKKKGVLVEKFFYDKFLVEPRLTSPVEECYKLQKNVYYVKTVHQSQYLVIRNMT